MNKTAESTVRYVTNYQGIRLQILTITTNMMKIQHQKFPSTVKHKLRIRKI